jgi:energy-coupling factor transport system permease protein
VAVSINNPYFSLVSLLCGVIYTVKIKGKAIARSLVNIALLVPVVGLFNMLFAHYGETVLFKIKDVEFTLQALFYGINQGMVLAGVVVWLIAFGEIVDSEKIAYVFRYTPKLSLIFSMVIGFIPRFIRKHNDIKNAKLALNSGKAPKTLKQKMSTSVENFSALITYCLESSIITSQSMEARGYNPTLIRYSRYKIKPLDIVVGGLVAILTIIVAYEKISGNIVFVFDPYIYSESFSTLAFVAFAVLELLPIIIDLWEDLLWKLSNAKN